MGFCWHNGMRELCNESEESNQGGMCYVFASWMLLCEESEGNSLEDQTLMPQEEREWVENLRALR